MSMADDPFQDSGPAAGWSIPDATLPSLATGSRLALPGLTELHVWLLSVDGGAPQQAASPLLNVLDDRERARAGRYRQAEAQARFRLTRAGLRLLLGRYLGCDPAALHFTANPHGKPRLEGIGEDQGLVFNVSHSGCLAVLAFAAARPLGVDLECCRPGRDYRRLARSALTDTEQAAWRALPADCQALAFCRFWSAKEAFLKATGRGIALGLQRVEVAPDWRGYTRVPDLLGPAGGWQLVHRVRAAYCLSIASRGDPAVVRFLNAESVFNPCTEVIP